MRACAFDQQVGLEPLEAADRVVREALDLGEPARDRRGSSRGRRGARCLVGRRLRSSAAASARPSGGADASVRVGWTHSELDYDLPPELIAQHPLDRRDDSRLLVFARATRRDVATRRSAICRELADGTLTVVNDTRVVPARIQIERRAARFCCSSARGDEWEALARPTRRLRPGQRFGPVELLEHLGEGRWRVRLDGEPAGAAPLPPYITEPLADPERYQTVYARARRLGGGADGGAALHAGAARAARRRAGDAPRRARHVPAAAGGARRGASDPRRALRGRPEAWQRIRAADRVLAVGTTTVRVLETLARGGPLSGRTELFITPGFEFRRVDHLLTNFHLPRSTLLALVMAFAGVEEIRRLYEVAVEERYRFYSFGDAMLVL